MESKFDPDDIDVADDPEYRARVDQAGPINNVRWAPDGAASLAKRAEMLDIDREMSAAWIVAMEKLLERDLSDAEFTTERMLRLRRWTKERKRRQHNLHYKYDPTRRPPRLVERDSKKQLAKLRAELEALQAKRRGVEIETMPAVPVEHSRRETPPRVSPQRARDVTAGPAFIPAPTKLDDAEQFVPDYLDPSILALIEKDTGIKDPGRASDAEVLKAYESFGQGGYVAEYYLALLRGRTPPERPDELG